MKYILAGIDGTGSRVWIQTSGGSSVRRFVADFDPQEGAKQYFPGPDNQATGSDSTAILQDVMNFIYASYYVATNIRLPWEGPPDLPLGERMRAQRQIFQTIHDRVAKIVLVGHSRGGLIAILAAAGLQPPVDFLGLYDAVDRVYGPDGSEIRNVRVTYHALRDPSIGSRPSFGNTGRRSTGRYIEEHFETSHGGIGGAYEPRPSGPFADYSCSVDYERSQSPTPGWLPSSPVTPGTRAALCATESRSAEAWMRDAARREGLRLNGR
ncbi:MAG: hypothetical protein R3E97_06405 [Candidatus Eisenbacteria bacterium]